VLYLRSCLTLAKTNVIIPVKAFGQREGHVYSSSWIRNNKLWKQSVLVVLDTK
jgi:hypothetical protein